MDPSQIIDREAFLWFATGSLDPILPEVRLTPAQQREIALMSISAPPTPNRQQRRANARTRK